MQPVSQALDQVRELYQKVLGKPAPDIHPGSFVPFPPGVNPLEHVVQEVDQLQHLSEQVAFSQPTAAWRPAADTFLTKDSYVVRMEIPGVERDTLKVFLVGGDCVVRGERKLPELTPDVRPLSFERLWGTFERRFTLPAGSHPDKVAARYADGVLEVKVAIEGIEKPKEMNVEVA